MRIPDTFGNLKSSLHGGAAATIIDTATTIAIAGVDKSNRVNVTSDLSVCFMGAAFLEDEIYVLSEVNKVGKRLAFTECGIYNEDCQLLMSGRHTKAFLDAHFDLDKMEW